MNDGVIEYLEIHELSINVSFRFRICSYAWHCVCKLRECIIFLEQRFIVPISVHLFSFTTTMPSNLVCHFEQTTTCHTKYPITFSFFSRDTKDFWGRKRKLRGIL